MDLSKIEDGKFVRLFIMFSKKIHQFRTTFFRKASTIMDWTHVEIQTYKTDIL